MTPQQLREQHFERIFRGYDPDAVEAVLRAAAEAWQPLHDENQELRAKVAQLQDDYTKLKAVESTLYRTIQTAQQTSQEMLTQAESVSQRQLDSSRQEADKVLTEARKQAQLMLVEAENKARYLIEEAEKDLKSIERDCRAIDHYRDVLIAQVKTYAGDTLEKLRRFEQKKPTGSLAERVQALMEALPQQPAPRPAAPKPAPKSRRSDARGSDELSFFDQL